MAKFKQWIAETSSRLRLKGLQTKLQLQNIRDKYVRTGFIKSALLWLNQHKYHLIGGIGAVGLTVAISLGGHQYVDENTIEVYHVYAGDELIGTVSDPAVIELFFEQKYAELAATYPDIHMELDTAPINLKAERAFKATFDDQAVQVALAEMVTPYARAVEIRVDGQLIGVVRDHATADALLNQLKEPYGQLPDSYEDGNAVQVLSANAEEEDAGKTQVMIERVEFVEDVEVRPIATEPEAIMDSHEVLEKLKSGETVGIVYTVQPGDCVSCIAEKLDISEEYIYDKNPEVKDSLLQIGQEIDLTEFVPLVSVKTVEIREEVHDVHYETQYVEDDTLKAGKTVVLQEGKEGKKQVTLRVTKINGAEQELEIVDEEILIEPTPRIIKKGTKIVPGEGTGKFAWPVANRRITSGYGERWGSLHKGIDMVSSNKNIMAADNGKVIFAGTRSGYGNAIIIDHGNGFQTLYGHLSKISVKKGAIVEKGEVIGVMGNTGNSYGVHLHFEIHKDGKAQNPIKYLDS
jgi:murein DD-endopeptidase MepM/ murein hydrolase activator NlpD